MRVAKDTGLRNLPLHGFDQDRIWCALVALAVETTAWMRLLTLTGPDPTTHAASRWEPKRLRHRLFTVPTVHRPGRPGPNRQASAAAPVRQRSMGAPGPRSNHPTAGPGPTRFSTTPTTSTTPSSTTGYGTGAHRHHSPGPPSHPDATISRTRRQHRRNHDHQGPGERSSYAGAADHLVSQSFYFTDPEDNGIELTWDRSCTDWTWQGGHIVGGLTPLWWLV